MYKARVQYNKNTSCSLELWWSKPLCRIVSLTCPASPSPRPCSSQSDRASSRTLLWLPTPPPRNQRACISCTSVRERGGRSTLSLIAARTPERHDTSVRSKQKSTSKCSPWPLHLAGLARGKYPTVSNQTAQTSDEHAHWHLSAPGQP